MRSANEHTYPWRCDDVLVCVSGVEWVAKNVFLVAVPSYARKLSCELTAVDVPRGTAAAVIHVVAAVLAHVNDAMRVYLRQDVYSDFPLEGYGDIIFSAESRAVRTSELHWCSLQETLVRAGVACLVRPCVVRCAPLLQAELHSDATDAAKTTSWLAQLRQRERSPLFCAVRRCVVADVVRGDVYRVTWAAGDADGADAVALPPLLVLDATVCQPSSTAKGYAALRWAQTHLLHRELRVHVHAVYPSDKDVAHNTQLETYEHLANARGTAWVAEGRETGEAADVGEVLVSAGLAWVRRVAEAGVPRASNLLPLCRAVGDAAAETLAHRHGAVDACGGAWAAVARAWRLPPAAAAELAAFNGAWWAAAAAAASTSLPRDAVGGTRELWRRVLWCGDLHTDPNDEPRVYRHRPLRTLFPLAALALRRVRLTGHVEGGAVVRCGATARAFLQVEVTAAMPSTEWKLLRRAAGYTDTCSVTFAPAPTDAVYARSVNVAISATGFTDDTETRLRVSCKHYLAETFLLSQHTPSKDWVVTETGEYVAPLSLRGTGQQPTIFVLDVVVEARDEHAMTWTQRATDRAVYTLAPGDAGLEADEPGDREAGGDGGKGKVTADGDTKASRVKGTHGAAPPVILLSKVSLFFELNAALLEPAEDNADTGAALLPRIQKAFADLVYDDVVVVPVGVAEVNGVRGLVGDLFFSQETVPRATRHPLRPRASAPFHRSLLTSIGWAWWGGGRLCGAEGDGAGASWPMREAVCDAVQASFSLATEGVARAERAARQSQLEEAQWAYGLLQQQAQNTFPTYQPPSSPFTFDELPSAPTTAPPPCLCLTAGEATLWHDSAAECPRLELAADVLPPTLPLSLFAVRPRELFYAAASKKKTVVARAAGAPPPQTLQEEAYEQLDWAFMRLQLPNLPNILRLDWERLPRSLRNTERALCASIVDKAVSTSTEPGMLYTSERVFSSFLSYLALLQAMSSSAGGGTAAEAARTDTTLARVYTAMQQYTASVLEDAQQQMRFSATLFVLPPLKPAGGGRPVPHSRPLFLGSRDNYATDLFDTPTADNASPEIAGFPLPREVTRACVSALGVEVLVRRCDDSATRDTCVSVDAGLEPDRLRTLGGGSLGWGASKESGAPVLYHPTRRIAVLGAPLVERDEVTADAVGRLRLEQDLFADVASSSLRRQVVSLRYRCLARFADKNPYKSFSYGRISSQDMYMTLVRERARGAEVQAYMSLLLRKYCVAGQERPAATFPDGELTVYGLPAEPLYVHYRSRADLRFTFSTACAPLRHELLAIEAAHLSDAAASAAVAEVEERLLALYAESAADFVRRIYERVRRDDASSAAVEQVYLSFTLQSRDATTEPYLAIQVFPVLPTDAETTERVLDHATVWRRQPATPANPHRTFSLYGSRYGRLALAELRVSYDATGNKFAAKWNEAYEGVPPAAA